MTALVTGAGGFLGSRTVEQLLASGATDLRLLLRSSPAPVENLRQRYPHARLDAITGNLLWPASVEKALDGVDTIFHLAAQMKGSPAEMFLNTVVASKRLLEAMQRVKRVVLVSSFGVYGVAGLAPGALIDEQTPLETHPERRDPYSSAKLRQELLFREYQQKLGFELIVLRPGVLYGPGNASPSTRIGVRFPGFFLHVGGGNVLPLSYVDNCANAIAVVGKQASTAKVDTINVVDDDLVTSRQYLSEYKRAVRGFRTLPCPYVGAVWMSRGMEWYSKWSQGQLPAVLTPYKAAVLWKGNRFSNERLKAKGWRQITPTALGLKKTFDWLALDEQRR